MKLFFEMLTCFFAAVGISALFGLLLYRPAGDCDEKDGDVTEKQDGTRNP